MKYKLKKEDIFDEQFEKEMTLREQETAVWQYLVDHSQVSPKGMWLRMALLDKDTFFRRVKARRDGLYSNKNIKDEIRLVQQMKEEAEKIKNHRKIFEHARSRMKRDASWWFRIVVDLQGMLNKWITEEQDKYL